LPGCLKITQFLWVLGCGLDYLGFDSMQRKGTFSNTHGLPSEPTQLPVGWVPRALSLGVKRKDYIPTSSSVEIKNEWTRVSTPHLYLCDVYRDKIINFFVPSNKFTID